MGEDYSRGRDFLKANWDRVGGAWQSDQSKGVPVPLQEEEAKPGEQLIALLPADQIAPRGAPLLALLQKRASRRKYSDAALSREEFSFLCWSAAGIKVYRTRSSFRTAPSGGARHPLDLFVFVSRVEGLEAGLYRYQPVEHALALVRGGDDSPDLDAALLDQYWGAAAVFVFVAVPYRTEWRYGPVSHKLIALDAGHACQNLYLACEAIGAGTCAIGAYDQQKMDAYLGLDGVERFTVYAAPVGKA